MFEFLFSNSNEILGLLSFGIPLMIFGVLVGQFLGALPGFSGTNSLIVLLPLILSLDPSHGIMLMVSVYVAVRCGGGWTAVLVNIPGTGSDVMASLDGYPLSKQGKGAYVLGVNNFSSFLAAILTGAVVFFVAPSFAKVALNFGPKEMSMVILASIIIVGQLLADDAIKGWLACFFGFLLGTMGLCTMYATPRGHFGSIYLFDGLPLIPAIVGLFAFSEIMFLVHQKAISEKVDVGISLKTYKQVLEGSIDTLKRWKNVLMVSSIGMFIGMLPGAGAAIASFVSYNVTISVAKNKSMFGKGDIRGIIAAESADNAAAAGAMVPLMALGVPGSGTTAVMLVILTTQGVIVGPRMFTQEPLVASSIIISLILASLLMLVTSTLLAGVVSKITMVKTVYLIPTIIGFATIGAMTMRGYHFDLVIALVFGLIGYMARLKGFPPAAIIIGIILGPLLESYFMRSLRMSQGDLGIFFQGNINIALWILIVAILCAPWIKKFISAARNSG